MFFFRKKIKKKKTKFYINFSFISFFFFYTNKLINLLNKISYLNISNNLKIFNNGDIFFGDIFDNLNNSKINIFIEIYIYENDIIGNLFKFYLLKALDRKVVVVIIYDYIGCNKINYKFFNDLLDKGAYVFIYNSSFFFLNKFKYIFNRNHKKIFLIDNKIIYCGGMNISCDYANKRYGNCKFYDSMIKITGLSFYYFLESFLYSLINIIDFFTVNYFFINFFVKNKISLNLFKNNIIQVVYSNIINSITVLQESLFLILNNSLKYCYFITPYFLPDIEISKTIIKISKKGVDIRILTSGLSDIFLIKFASNYIYNEFLKNGIRIYEMVDKILHSKIFIVDDFFTFIGSYNLNHWSQHRNLESGLNIYNLLFSKKNKKKFYLDLLYCKELSLYDFYRSKKINKILFFFVYNLMRI